MITPGQPAPAWSIQGTLIDGPAGPEAYRGRPLLLLFFNIGCAGCTGRAIPYTLELHERYPQLHIVAIHSSFSVSSTYPVGQIKAVLDYFKIPYPVLLDEGETTFERYQAEGTPHWVLIDAEGRVLKSFFGSMEGAVQRMEYTLLELFPEA